MNMVNSNNTDELQVEGDDPLVADEGGPTDEYDLTASPNDFNVMTINSFIEGVSHRLLKLQGDFVL